MVQKYSAGCGLRYKPDGSLETLEEAEIRVGHRRMGWIAGAVVSTFLVVGSAAGCAGNADIHSDKATISDSTKTAKQFGFGVLMLCGAFGVAAFGVAASRDREKLDAIGDNIRSRDEYREWRQGVSELKSPSNDR